MNIRKYFEEHTGFGVLSTADHDGRVNAAVYARPHCFDNGTVGFIMPDRLTHANLETNGHATYLFREDAGPGKRRHAGLRMYLKLVGEDQNQDRIARLLRRTNGPRGEGRYLVIFAVEKVLPLIGTGTREHSGMEQPRTKLEKALARRFRESFSADDWSRIDEREDRHFYERDRLVPHLDSLARETVESIVGQLVVEEAPVVLDLMASWDSHLPAAVEPAHVVGLGLNRNELMQNPRLDRHVVHDLNREPLLPFDDQSFDVVLNSLSVDYINQPFRVFSEVGRILKPGGLFLITFSNRMFDAKAVRVWRTSSEEERVILVEEMLRYSGLFTAPQVIVSMGRPRPADDRYADIEEHSDPVYAVYAERWAPPTRPRLHPERPEVVLPFGDPPTASELRARVDEVKDTLSCPHCQTALSRLPVPDSPFNELESDEIYACLNEFCPYFVNGYSANYRSGQRGLSHCLIYDPAHQQCRSMPVQSLNALRTIAS